MRAIADFEGIYLYRDAVDMRKGIHGLCELVVFSEMGDLMGKNLFIFCGKRRKSLKILYFDKCGFALWQKVLQKEKFFWPRKFEKEVVVLNTQQLSWLLDGFDFLKMKPFAELQFEKFY